MGINFPASPTVGQLHPDPAETGIPQYEWNGTVWVARSEAPLTYVQRAGDTMTGLLMLSGNPVEPLHAVPKQYLSEFPLPRNRIVNGAMQFAQQYGDTLFNPTTGISAYIADQWAIYSSTAPAVTTMQRIQSVTPNGSRDRFRISVTTAKPSLAASDYLMFGQAIEGRRVPDFKYGSASARQAIFRFGFKAPAGTYSICVMNAGTNRSYTANFTIAPEQANTDTEQKFIVPGDTTGAWLIDAGMGILIRIILATGATYIGAAGWQGGVAFGTSSNTNGLAQLGVFELFDVGWYLDENNTGVAPKWQLPDAASELLLCQRYYSNFTFTFWGNAPAGGYAFGQTFLFPTMRAAPTVLVSDLSYANAYGAAALSSAINSVAIYAISSAAGQTSLIAAGHLDARY
jgi:hypothetical protein